MQLAFVLLTLGKDSQTWRSADPMEQAMAQDLLDYAKSHELFTLPCVERRKGKVRAAKA